MKSFKKLLISLSLLLSFSMASLAAHKNEATINLSDKVQLGSTQLAPGEYKLSWIGTGSDATATLSQGKRVVATVPAKLVEQRSQYSGVGIVTDTAGGGGTRLTGVLLPKLELQFDSDKNSSMHDSGMSGN